MELKSSCRTFSFLRKSKVWTKELKEFFDLSLLYNGLIHGDILVFVYFVIVTTVLSYSMVRIYINGP